MDDISIAIWLPDSVVVVIALGVMGVLSLFKLLTYLWRLVPFV